MCEGCVGGSYPSAHTHTHTLPHELKALHSVTVWLPPLQTHTLTHTHKQSLTHTHTVSHTHSLTHTHSLKHSQSLSHTLTHSLTHTVSNTHSLSHTHSLTLSLTHTHTHTLTHTQSLTHSHSHTVSHTQSLTHSLSHTVSHTQSLTHTHKPNNKTSQQHVCLHHVIHRCSRKLAHRTNYFIRKQLRRPDSDRQHTQLSKHGKPQHRFEGRQDTHTLIPGHDREYTVKANVL